MYLRGVLYIALADQDDITPWHETLLHPIGKMKRRSSFREIFQYFKTCITRLDACVQLGEFVATLEKNVNVEFHMLLDVLDQKNLSNRFHHET
jgi:hypothetical protein